KTYGSLGAVIVLMLWLYLTGAAILIGGEVNSEIEDAAAKAGAPDAKEKGEKVPDEKSGGRATQKTRPAAARVETLHPARRVRRKDGKGLTVGKVATVFGAWCLGLLHRTAKKESTAQRGH
ncbi:MAG TPA: YhjD/YihY/BrkB family envelope integrity protein, partial [Pyrinomonadaceae bacterium]|nr:YhjD/YihY/BrkB family envelope integrity protein [Pyrinomonadaceae bacterium]